MRKPKTSAHQLKANINRSGLCQEASLHNTRLLFGHGSRKNEPFAVDRTKASEIQTTSRLELLRNLSTLDQDDEVYLRQPSLFQPILRTLLQLISLH